MRGARSDRARAAVVLGAVHARGEADAGAHADAAPRGEVELAHGRAGTETLPATPGRLRVHGRGVLLELQLEEQAGIEALCPNGHAQVWTRKQAGVAAHGTLQIDGGPMREDRRARRDRRHDRASRPPHRVALERRRRREPGRHPAGLEPRQRRQRPATGQRAAVWVAGSPTEVAPVSFAADLSSIRCEDGAELRFLAEAQRSRHDELLIVGSDYRAPFGTSAGRCPAEPRWPRTGRRRAPPRALVAAARLLVIDLRCFAR